MKIWIARDCAKYESEYEESSCRRHPERAAIYSALHLFYDKPDFKKDVWCCARIASDIPNYMFPDIQPGECWEFSTDWDNIPEYMHWKGRMVNKDNYLEGK